MKQREGQGQLLRGGHVVDKNRDGGVAIVNGGHRRIPGIRETYDEGMREDGDAFEG